MLILLFVLINAEDTDVFKGYRLREVNGSSEIQDIDNYGNLVALMMSLQQSSDGFSGKQSVMAGTCPGLISEFGETYVSTVGDKLTGYAGNLAANGVVPDKTFCLNLMSYVGSLSGNRYVPLF